MSDINQLHKDKVTVLTKLIRNFPTTPATEVSKLQLPCPPMTA